MIRKIIEKSLVGEQLSPHEIRALFTAPLFSDESALIQSTARQICQKACNGFAEVHAQIGLNTSSCPRNCRFCSFAACNGIFLQSSELPVEEVVYRAKDFEANGANAIYLMITATYSFEKFIEISQEVKSSLKPETILIANVDDFTQKQALQLKDAGFSGIYHAVRLGEGRDTGISPDKRLKTFMHARAVGLLIGTCVEPIGPEHSIEELVDKTIITRNAEPAFSGAMRRIPIPNTVLAAYGMVSEARMAHILAVVRLSLGYNIHGNCTHEPNTIGAAAGANLIWSETGSNPRDTEKETQAKRGMTIQECRNVLKEAEWTVLAGPSRFFSSDKNHEAKIEL